MVDGGTGCGDGGGASTGGGFQQSYGDLTPSMDHPQFKTCS